MEKQEWSKFKTETKKQLATFVKCSEFGDTAKHVILDAFDKEPEHTADILATLRIIGASNNAREIAVAGLLVFLWEYEVNYVLCIDAFCHLLIANGHDLFNGLRQKYVHGLKDIGIVDVHTKLNFLKEHNFGILSREEDQMLRNKIAHHDFIIDDSGKVFINNKVVDVGSRFNELSCFIHRVFETFCHCWDEC